MKYGILADIHSNLPALQSIVSLLSEEQVEGYLVAGDLVGYGPHPNECIEIIRSLASATVIVGNHDWAIIDLEDISAFNEDAKAAILWTKSALSKTNLEYISSLEYCAQRENWMMVHGSPRDPLDEYMLTIEHAAKSIPFMKARLCFLGHSHHPLHFWYDQASQQIAMKELLGQEEVSLNDENQHFLNPGSVGQPRDNNAKASCAIFDTEHLTFKILRTEYDIAFVQEEMRKQQLPEYLINRLQNGV